jgi:hypothetical protein
VCPATCNLFGSVINAVLTTYTIDRLGMTLSPGRDTRALSGGSLLGALVAGRLATHVRVGWPIIISRQSSGPGPHRGRPSLRGVLLDTRLPSRLARRGRLRRQRATHGQALLPLRLQGRLNARMRFIVQGTIMAGSGQAPDQEDDRDHPDDRRGHDGTPEFHLGGLVMEYGTPDEDPWESSQERGRPKGPPAYPAALPHGQGFRIPSPRADETDQRDPFDENPLESGYMGGRLVQDGRQVLTATPTRRGLL